MSARNIALGTLFAVLHEGAYSNIALNRALEKYRPAKLDRAFITELVYGTLRNLGTIDWILAGFLKKPLSDLPPKISAVLRMGVHQIFFMDKVPDSAACNESANLAKKFGHAGTVKLVNGVLRNVARNREQIQFPDIAVNPVEGIAVRYAHPRWLVERWVAELGPAETERLCRANNQVPPNSIRTNTLAATRDGLKEELTDEGLEAVEGRFAPETLNISGFKSVGSLTAHQTGLFMVQDESSTLVGHAVQPAPGSFVIDACGAPGGKSTHLAQLMNNQGEIISADIYPHKLKLIEENAARLGVKIIKPVLLDAVELHQKYKGAADYILVDAPCSGLGVLRRRPEIRWRKGPEEIAVLQRLQLSILESAARSLKSGGVLVYSTCTVTREENNDVIEQFLAQHQDFQLETLTGRLPDALLAISDNPEDGYLQFMPHIHGTDGFFLARMRKQ